MRILLAIAMLVGGMLTLSAGEDAARKRSTRSHDYYAAQPRTVSRQAVECERARHEDPTGVYAGYPCWAREALGRGTQGGTRGGRR